MNLSVIIRLPLPTLCVKPNDDDDSPNERHYERFSSLDRHSFGHHQSPARLDSARARRSLRFQAEIRRHCQLPAYSYTTKVFPVPWRLSRSNHSYPSRPNDPTVRLTCRTSRIARALFEILRETGRRFGSLRPRSVAFGSRRVATRLRVRTHVKAR